MDQKTHSSRSQIQTNLRAKKLSLAYGSIKRIRKSNCKDQTFIMPDINQRIRYQTEKNNETRISSNQQDQRLNDEQFWKDVNQISVAMSYKEKSKVKVKKQQNQPYQQLIALLKQKFPKQRKKRTISILKQICTQIKNFNPFFRKLDAVSGCILLKMGQLITINRDNYIYRMNYPAKYIYIIICGKVILNNSLERFHKYAINGQSLTEEALFNMNLSINHKNQTLHTEDAKANFETCLLRIKISVYKSLEKQLCKLGKKNLYNHIHKLLQINYINKKSLLNRNKNQNSFINHLTKQRRYKCYGIGNNSMILN